MFDFRCMMITKAAKTVLFKDTEWLCVTHLCREIDEGTPAEHMLRLKCAASEAVRYHAASLLVVTNINKALHFNVCFHWSNKVSAYHHRKCLNFTKHI